MCEQYLTKLISRKDYDLIFYALSPKQPQKQVLFILQNPSLEGSGAVPSHSGLLAPFVSPVPTLPPQGSLLSSPFSLLHLLPSPSRLDLLSCYRFLPLYFFHLSFLLLPTFQLLLILKCSFQRKDQCFITFVSYSLFLLLKAGELKDWASPLQKNFHKIKLN